MNKQKILTLSILTALVFQFLPLSTGAALIGHTGGATLRLELSDESVMAGEAFTADIMVNTGGESVVVVAAYIDFNPVNFEVIGIETAGSVFGMGFEQVIDNENGRIRVTRGLPSPGVNNTDGFVARVNFRSLSAVDQAMDNITLNFIPGSTADSNVIKDDGLGTDILTGVYNARVRVAEAVRGKVGLSPAQQTTAVGNTFKLELNVENAADFANIVVEIHYDDSVMNFEAADLSGFNAVCADGFAFEDSFTPGLVSVFAECWDGLSGNFTIGELSFTALTDAAESEVKIDNLIVFDSAFNELSYDISGALVTAVTSADTEAPVITVMGPNPATVEKGSVYADAGAHAYDNKDGNISGAITVDNPVDTDVPGTYTVRYNATDAAGNAALEKTRTVNVADTTRPVILSGGVDETTAYTATVAWTTDEPASSQLEYGLTPALGSQSELSGMLLTSHSVTITGLAPNTTYHYRAKSADSAGNTAMSNIYTFTTLEVPAIAPVILSGGSENITENSATIFWTTDKAATSQVEYGTTADLGSATETEDSLKSSHSVVLTGLNGNTAYHYRAKSVDQDGLAVTSGIYTFTTQAPSQPNEPEEPIVEPEEPIVEPEEPAQEPDDPGLEDPENLITYKNIRLAIPTGMFLDKVEAEIGTDLDITRVYSCRYCMVSFERGSDNTIITVSPRRNFTGVASFKYNLTAADGTATTGEAIVEVRATESPVAPPITLNTAKNFRVSIAVADIIANAHDPEGLSLTVSALRHSVNGRAYYERGTNREVISFSPRRNFTGQASFKYVLKNESGDSVLGDIIVEVDPTEAPVTPPIILTTDKNIAVSIKTADILANANDPQGQTLTFSGLRNSVNGRAYYERGTNREVISFTPRRNFIGEASLKYALKNQSGDDVLGEIIVAVDPTEAPLAAAEEFVTPLNTALTVPIAGLLANDSDPNGQEITFDGTRNAKNCRVSYERGDRSKLVITPRRNFSGQAFFTYRIENQSGDIGTATVNIEVIQ